MTGALGPRLGWRPWRLTAGVCLGMACATKWSGLWFVVVFGLMTVLWDVGARKTAGVRRPWVGTLARDAWPAFASLVLVSLVVYVASWTGWFLSDAHHAYNRDWAQDHPGPWFVPSALVSLWHYHEDSWQFHTNLTDFHPYRSNPWGWLVLARPVSYFYRGPKLGEDGCHVDQCSQAVVALGTPAIWWAACLALPVLVYLWAGTPRLARRRDPGRRGRGLPAVVPLRLPHDLLVLRRRVRAVPRAGRDDVPRVGHRRGRTRPSGDGSGGSRRPVPTCCSRSRTSPTCCR